jgi:hypothetical protein
MKLLPEVPEDKGLARCRVPGELFKLRTLIVNQWTQVISSNGILYSRAWPFLKNGSEQVVQSGSIISREPESQSEIDCVASLSGDECNIYRNKL